MDHDFMDYFHEKIIQRFIMLCITSLLWAGSYVIDFQTESVLEISDFYLVPKQFPS